MTPQVCLGTAQFGLPYGITNSVGKVAEPEVRALLAESSAAGIAFLDTAQDYGDAEDVLGRTLPAGHSFQLITKFRAQLRPSFTADDWLIWEQAFQRTLVRLGQPSLEGLLLHDSADLCKPGGQYLQKWLLSLRERGLVRRLGISIYSSGDLDGVQPDLLDLVQLPLSLYDQRLLSDGTIARLRSRGCAVHARSLYLQGLLLSPATTWPSWVDPSDRDHHARLENLAADRGCTLLDCALGFARAQQDVEAVVLGICSRSELAQLLWSWRNSSPWDGAEWRQWSLENAAILDPRLWPQSKS